MMKSFSMGASIRKKLKKRGSNKNTQSQNTPPSKFIIKPKYIALIMAASFFVFFILLSSNSWDIRRVLGSKSNIDSSNQLYTIQVVNDFPHDPSAFTQGLLYAGNDTLFESTGLYGQSSVRKVNLHTGKVMDLKILSNSYFGEGLTLLGERLIQVTWMQKTGFIYNRNNLSQADKFTHHMQDGWGLANDGKKLFGTDGTSMLYQMDPETFRVIKKNTVKYNGREVPMLNELEYVNDEVWSNVYTTDCIARISPENGNVHGWILLDKLSLADQLKNVGAPVPNGVATLIRQSSPIPKFYQARSMVGGIWSCKES
ncbi:hypothetical protein LIER_32833 [Lithospermum erythrorhizon]|uniref:Glutaminyl-peptide cyclotransferase n=1 Tax=Lithospermum erythrorhizon TaxID=34254 RepID=A0AAV3RXG8_LITER